jgi:hypothetical protein
MVYEPVATELCAKLGAVAMALRVSLEATWIGAV